MTHDEMIDIIRADQRGEQVQYKSRRTGRWENCTTVISWNFHDNKYRIKPKEPREWYVQEINMNSVGILQPSEGTKTMKANGLILVREVMQ